MLLFGTCANDANGRFWHFFVSGEKDKAGSAK